LTTLTRPTTAREARKRRGYDAVFASYINELATDQRSSTTPSRGREQQIRALPSAGASTGSGL
jgi:hypothetical protein